MPGIKDLLGNTVINGSGEDVATNQLGEYVGLYFSAHWCPPCRGFTPKLVEFYNGFKQSDTGKTFDVVFVSSDRDENSFQEYFREMPWLALPFSDRDRKVTTFSGTSIPVQF